MNEKIQFVRGIVIEVSIHVGIMLFTRITRQCLHI